MPTPLTGTIIGTAGTYRNHPDVAANAFDGNLSTFFDAPDASGDWVGLNLGTPSVLTQVQYAPRGMFSSRMVGGSFQGSSTSDFSANVVNLFTISSAPAYGVLTAQPISNATPFQYVRYVGPSQGYCNIAELEFDGYPQTSSLLPFNVSGTSGSWQNDGNTVANAADGNLSTFFDAPTGNGNYVQAIFSSEANLMQISFAPRAGYSSRMIGGLFQASNSATFTSGDVNLYTITAAPPSGVLTTVPITTPAAYEFVRYIAPPNSYGNVAEINFTGRLTGVLPPPSLGTPSITSSSPATGAMGVSPDTFISCALNLPNGAGVDPSTMTATTVYLYRTFDHTIVPTVTNTDAVGSVIVAQPESPLDGNTQYTFVVTAEVKDVAGAAFAPFSMNFTTGSATVPTDSTIAFQPSLQSTTTGHLFSGVTVGPDGNLYANTLSGQIFQYPIGSNGSLGTAVNVAAAANMPTRLITGIAFAPGSNASNMTLWISSGDIAQNNAPDFTGTIGAIQISNGVVGAYQVYVTGLPRSNSNHLNNQPVFGPDGALYWGEGSNSSMGAPDAVWGNRPEHLLNAAILRLNVQLVQQYVTANNQPLNVQTDSLPAGQAAYNPYATGAPLTIYATGVRNAYDLIWDNNGHLYAPTNGAAAGGNIPATPVGVTPSAPAVNGVSSAEDDYLYDIAPGGYYGHPDPARGQYIFGGGNPIHPQSNWAIQTAYPLGTNPDPNYKGYAFDFGPHYSPDGAIEYTGNAFGGALNGALLITEYSGGKDVVVLRTGSNGQITAQETGIAGFTGFSDPVDITEDPATGNLYVADLGTSSISLLTPIAGGATISASSKSLTFNAVPGGPITVPQAVTITNTGTQPLAIGAGGLLVTGSNGSMFPIANKPALPAIIPAGSSITVSIAFNPENAPAGTYTASVVIATNDQVSPILTIPLSATVKAMPPAMPTAVQAAGSSGGITISWTASTTTPIRGYLVYRSTSSRSGYSMISNGAFAGTSFIDTTATPGVRYYYTLATDDNTGVISPFTVAVSAVIPVTA